MSQAFNLSQFANKLNTSGEIGATTGITGTFPTTNLPTIPINKGGTNLTTVGANGTVVQTDGSAYTYGSISGTLTWDTVKTSGFTAVAGYGYFVNTTSAAITVTLPASPTIGQRVVIVDYAGTFATNNVTVSPNGSKINAGAAKLLQTNRMGIAFVYIDSTQGWLAQADVYSGNPPFINAPITVTYLVVAGGGGGGSVLGGGGGAGGYLTGTATLVSGTSYTATIGGGGTAGLFPFVSAGQGNTSSLIGGVVSVSATGGGKGGNGNTNGGTGTAGSGGSGGGGGGGNNNSFPGGSSTPGQGNNGSSNNVNAPYSAGAGGGASAAGGTASSTVSGAGGSGTANSITGSSIYYSGGGGGAGGPGVTAGAGTPSTGGGGAGQASAIGTSGTSNTGGGGGGGGQSGSNYNGGTGGSGVVILSIPTASYSGTTTGSPTVTTSGSNTILQYTASGTYTA